MKVYFYKDTITHDCIPGSLGYIYKINGSCVNDKCSFSISPSILVNIFEYKKGAIVTISLFPKRTKRSFTNYIEERIDITKLVQGLRD